MKVLAGAMAKLQSWKVVDLISTEEVQDGR
jgi:hypothetical protein